MRSLKKLVVSGILEGKRARRWSSIRWSDHIIELMGLSPSVTFNLAQDQEERRQIVYWILDGRNDYDGID